jgi:hypothetical protein
MGRRKSYQPSLSFEFDFSESPPSSIKITVEQPRQRRAKTHYAPFFNSDGIQSRKCSQCGEIKPVTEYSPTTKGRYGLYSACRKCYQVWQKASYLRTNGRGARNAHLRETYGVTLDEYNAMLTRQGWKCAICGTPAPEEGERSFPVDHDHKTGKVRAILCTGCNAGIGMFKENASALHAAVEYLQIHNE